VELDNKWVLYDDAEGHESVEHGCASDTWTYMPLIMQEGYVCAECGEPMPESVLGFFRAAYSHNPPVRNPWNYE
jgi:hypothetical protein